MKYIIKENQFKELINLKRNKKLVQEISSKIDRINNSLNETILIGEAISDILLIYNKKGLINNYIKQSLIESGKLSESHFKRIKL